MSGQASDKYSSGHIRNPLTVISRFAAIAEISGTAVLPFIAQENQAVYIWFLMLFPALLVGLFFLTLNFNHKTLYAPSDYKNQNHFLNLLSIATSDERESKLEAELEEEANLLAVDSSSLSGAPTEATTENCQPQQGLEPPTDQAAPAAAGNEETIVEELSTQPQTKNPKEAETPPAPNTAKKNQQTLNLQEIRELDHIKLKDRLEKIENEAIAKLSSISKIKFGRNIKIETGPSSAPLMFDGVAIQNKFLHAAEVKYFPDDNFSVNRMLHALKDAFHASQIIEPNLNRDFVFHIIVVIDGEISRARFDIISKAIYQLSKGFNLKTNLYAIEESKLLNRDINYTFFTKEYRNG